MHSTKKEALNLAASPSVLKAFFLASRPKTWIASIAPVIFGIAFIKSVDLFLFTLTLLFSLLIQIGTNFANDYFDFVKGVDNHLRNGPKRATQEGWVRKESMLLATTFTFFLSFVIAIPLMIEAGTWSIFAAICCIASGLLYTAGPKPIGYVGLGEVFVFIFFGPVATIGTFFLQEKTAILPVMIASLIPGFFSTSLILINNLRDAYNDSKGGKKTIVVRYGKEFGTKLYRFCVFAPFALTLMIAPFTSFSLLLVLIIFPFAYLLSRQVMHFKDPFELFSTLPKTAALFFLFTLIFTFSL